MYKNDIKRNVWLMKPTAKKLILGLLLASDGRPLSVREAISACTLFSITENNVRVSLARMSAEGLIKSQGRGAYGLGPASRITASQAAQWHDAETLLCDWNGGYICVHSAALGRSDRKAMRQRERALEMLGLRELGRGLHLRPDNLVGGVDALRGRLLKLGLEAEAMVFRATQFDSDHMPDLENLWSVKALNAIYREEHRRLEDWMARCGELEADVAARESYLIGGAAIRQLVFDPWLPEPMIDAKARHAFVETVKRFDETGKAIWSRLSENDHPMPMAEAASPLTAGPLH